MTIAVYIFSVLALAHCAWAQDNIGVSIVQPPEPVHVDQTLARGPGGCEVIEAVLAKLTVSALFPADNGFLRRVAYVETEAGRRILGNGGPWAVSDDVLRRTQTAHPALTTFKESLLNSSLLKSPSGGAIDWSTVSTQDLARPLYSAIAARFYLQLQLSATGQTDFSPRLDEQAKFWVTYYANTTRSSNRTEADFLEKTRQLDDECACKASIDMAFVMDMSGSVGKTNFQSAKNFTGRIVKSFSIGPNKTRVGLITYSTNVHLQFDLDDYSNKIDTIAAIERTQYKGGWTRTGDAIRAMIEDMFNQCADVPTTHSRSTTVALSTSQPATSSSSQGGNGGSLPDVGTGLSGQGTQGTSPPTTAVPIKSLRPVQLKSRVGIVVTDGKSQDDVLPPSLRAQQCGITMFAIGVGRGYKLSELKEIASDPDQAHVFTVGDYSAIDNIRANLRRRSCQASAPVSIGQPVSGTVGGNETTYAAVPIDDSEEVTITLEAVEGAITLYTSLTVPNPSEALHDHKLSLSAGQQGSLLISPSQDSPLAGGNSRRQRRQVQPTSSDTSQRKLYISIQGQAATNKFNLQSQLGNHVLLPSPTPSPFRFVSSPTPRVASGSCAMTTKIAYYITLLASVLVIFAAVP